MNSINFINIFSLLLIICSIFVTSSTNSVVSLLFLILCFIFSSFIIILLECEFIALMILLIYVGAISILFLFAIMMLEHKRENFSKDLVEYLPAGSIFGLFLLSIFIVNVRKNFLFSHEPEFEFFYTNWFNLTDFTTDLETYALVLYTYYVLNLLIVGLILLMVLLGIVYLTKSFSVVEFNRNVPSFKQVARTIFSTKNNEHRKN